MTASAATAIPYVQLPRGSFGGQFLNGYTLIIVAALVLGLFAAAWLGRRVRAPDAMALAAVCIAPAWVCAHVLDVLVYRLDVLDVGVLVRLYDGFSLFGALIGVIATTWIWVSARSLVGAVYADVMALGCLVVNAVGRIGCAGYHDHPGVRTDSILGVDFPPYMAVDSGWTQYQRFGEPSTIRLHDPGMLELGLMIPFVIVMFVLARRGLRPGWLAVIIAGGYAVLRFPLDFLRAPRTEPTQLGLTSGQWGCILLAILAGVAATAWMRRART